MEIIELSPSVIKIKPGFDRFREDLGDIEGLKKSILRTRQILPIVITRKHELIDGGRRLTACILAGIKVKAVYEDVVEEYEMRELELEANLFRKDYSPSEEALAIRELHRLKQKTEGHEVGDSGVTDGWDIGHTAKLLGKSRGTVYNALEAAELIDVFPELKHAKKKSEIMKAGKGLIKLNKAIDGVKKYEETRKDSNKITRLYNTDAVEFMCKIPDKAFDIILTDPIYGIGADMLNQTIGGKTGGVLTTAGFKIEDDKESAYLYYTTLAKEGYRFTSDTAQGYVFVGPEHFWKIREIFLSFNWSVHVKPLIWIKRAVGQSNVPTMWPASCYEMIMFIRKEEARLKMEGKPDWLECVPVLPSDKTHPYEKPVQLIVDLLERICYPGDKLIDPFMGSGAIIEAGTQMNLLCTGVDNSMEAYAVAMERITKLEEKE